MIPRNARLSNNRAGIILANRKPPGKPATGIPIQLLDGKKRGNLIFTGQGVRIRRMRDAIPTT
jgi:hypothetical protein